MVPRHSCDALVIGGGLAGLQAAEVLSQFVSNVVVVDKGAVGRAPASLADASAFAAYLAQDAGGVDHWKMPGVIMGGAGEGAHTPVQRGFYAYRKEIIDYGEGLCDPLMADFTASGIYNRIGWLESYGLHVARNPDKTYRGFPAPGHSLNRVALLEEKPEEILAGIRRSAESLGVSFREGIYITRILTAGGRVVGAYGVEAAGGEPVLFEARAIILAAGSADRLYNEGGGTTGDAFHLALGAGASVANIEFVAFGPAVKEGGLPAGLLMVLLGLGARLEDKRGSLSLAGSRPVRAWLRDLARALNEGAVRLSIAPEVKSLVGGLQPFAPWMSVLEKSAAIEISCRALLGGVVHRVFATRVPGLYVAGGAATGCHGADLLPGVDTSFALYSAENAAGSAAVYLSRTGPAGIPEPAVQAEKERLENLSATGTKGGRAQLAEMEERLRKIMWQKVGVERSGEGLKQARAEIQKLGAELQGLGPKSAADLVSFCELKNLLLTAEMVCLAALEREETRGQHCRVDFPQLDPAREVWLSARREDGAERSWRWEHLPVPQPGSDRV